MNFSRKKIVRRFYKCNKIKPVKINSRKRYKSPVVSYGERKDG